MVSKETLDETSMMDTELCGTVFCLRESINQVTSVGKKPHDAHRATCIPDEKGGGIFIRKGD